MRWRVRARLPFPAGSGLAAHAQANMDATRAQAQPIDATGEPVVSRVEAGPGVEVYAADFPLSGDAQGHSRAVAAADWLQALLPQALVVGDLAAGDPGTDWPFVQLQACRHDQLPPPPCEVVRQWPPPPASAWVAPSGGHEPYPAGWVVEHGGRLWRCVIPGAVWEPGVAGWEPIDDG